MNGYIFRCNDKTKEEVFSRSLFGDEVMYVPVVKQITEQDYLFLYDLTTFEFSGPYLPIGSGGAHLVPAAWKAKFPAQIKYKVIPETNTIAFKLVEKVITVYHKGMYPDMKLDEKQVKKILEILETN